MDVSRLREVFTYDALSGQLMRAGRSVGTVNKHGYIVVRVDGKLLYVHRIIWCLMTGAAPKHTVDHRNGNRADNRWCNLREATPQEQAANRRVRADNTLQVKGVRRSGSKYRAVTWHNGMCVDCGVHSTIEQAAAAYDRAAAEIHGQFARS